MAWALRSKSGVTSSSAGNLTLTEPAGASEGDLLVAFIGYRDSAAFTLPADWTVVSTQLSTGDTDATSGIGSAVMAYIVRGSTAPSYAFTRTAGDIAQGYVLCFTGNATTGVYDTGNAITAGVIAAGGEVASITTANANELLVVGFSGGDNTGATSSWTAATDPTTGWTEEGSSSVNTGADNTTSVAWNTKSTAGSTGRISVTTTGTSRAAMIVGAFVAEALAAITGSLASIETGSDTAAATGDVLVSGSFAPSETGSDTAALNGTVATSTGTLYYVIYDSALGAPSAAQVKAGQDVNSTAAVASGSETSPGTSQTFTFTSPATGLTASTSYRVAIVWTDGTNDSNVSVSDAWSTLANAVTGTLAATETGSDTAAITGIVLVSGALSVSETGSDTAAITGAVLVSGSLAATESGADTAAITGTVLVSGSLAATETGADTAFFNGSSVIISTGYLAASEAGSDTADFTGTAVSIISGYLDATEAGQDTAAVTGNFLIDGYLAATETGADTAFFNGSSAIIATGYLAATESGSDTAAATGKVIVSGTVAASESGQDTAAMTGRVLVLGELGAFEVDVDTASATGKVYVSGSMAAQETGNDTAGFFSAALRAVEMLTALERDTQLNALNRNATITALERDTLLESRHAVHG